jgi:hypothetical protein
MIIRAKILLLLLVLIHFNGTAQRISNSVIGSYGNFAFNSGGSLSSSMGEPMVASRFVASNILTEGFEQPDDQVSTSTSDIAGTDAFFKAYPIPAHNMLAVQGDFSKKEVELCITDITGRELVLINSKNCSDKTLVQLETENFKNGVYFLTITDAVTRQKIQTIKIIKA